MTRRMLVVAPLALGLACSDALATIFQHGCPDISACPSQDEGGTWLSSTITYNNVTQDMSWTSVIAPAGSGPGEGGLPNLFWIAVTNGPAQDAVPAGSMAILIGDADTGTVVSYRYWDEDSQDGDSNDDDQRDFSWRDNTNNFIESIADALTITTDGFNILVDMSLNVAITNAAFGAPPDWTGFAFGEMIGFWAASFVDASVTFDNEGRIIDLERDGDKRTSWDRFDEETVVVPAPPAALVIALGAGLLACRRRRATS